MKNSGPCHGGAAAPPPLPLSGSPPVSPSSPSPTGSSPVPIQCSAMAVSGAVTAPSSLTPSPHLTVGSHALVCECTAEARAPPCRWALASVTAASSRRAGACSSAHRDRRRSVQGEGPRRALSWASALKYSSSSARTAASMARRTAPPRCPRVPRGQEASGPSTPPPPPPPPLLPPGVPRDRHAVILRYSHPSSEIPSTSDAAARGSGSPHTMRSTETNDRPSLPPRGVGDDGDSPNRTSTPSMPCNTNIRSRSSAASAASVSTPNVVAGAAAAVAGVGRDGTAANPALVVALAGWVPFIWRGGGGSCCSVTSAASTSSLSSVPPPRSSSAALAPIKEAAAAPELGASGDSDTSSSTSAALSRKAAMPDPAVPADSSFRCSAARDAARSGSPRALSTIPHPSNSASARSSLLAEGGARVLGEPTTSAGRCDRASGGACSALANSSNSWARWEAAEAEAMADREHGRGGLQRHSKWGVRTSESEEKRNNLSNRWPNFFCATRGRRRNGVGLAVVARTWRRSPPRRNKWK